MLPTPTILVQLPKPWWLRLLHKTALVGALALFGAAAFRIGQHHPLAPDAPFVPMAVPVAAPVAEPVPAPGIAAVAPAPSLSDEVPAEAPKDGLELKSFALAADPEAPGQLRYRLTLANSGRKFVGTLRFTVAGERNGKAEQWHHPAAGEAADPKLRVEVSRFLKTEGVITLPEGFAPKAATVDLLEPSGVRLSKQTRIGRPS